MTTMDESNSSKPFLIASFDVGEKNLAFCVVDIGADESIVEWKRYDVLDGKRRSVITESCDKISAVLENESWKDVRLVLIESQMRANVRAQRVSQHIWTWFRLSFPSVEVRFVQSSLKTKYFASDVERRTLSNKARKTWSSTVTRDILTKKSDAKHLAYLDSLIESKIKTDDVCDAYLQLLAYVRTNALAVDTRLDRKANDHADS